MRKSTIAIIVTVLAVGGCSAAVSAGSGPDTPEQSTSAPVETTTQVQDDTTTESAPEPEAAPEPQITSSQQRALEAAKNYLDMMGMSRTDLISQLKFDGYPAADAAWAADNAGASWSDEAAQSAANYLDSMPFSRSDLVGQLEFDGFTVQQAEYGVQAAY